MYVSTPQSHNEGQSNASTIAGMSRLNTGKKRESPGVYIGGQNVYNDALFAPKSLGY